MLLHRRITHAFAGLAVVAGTVGLVACSSNVNSTAGAAKTVGAGQKTSVAFIGFGDAVTLTQAIYRAMKVQGSASAADVTLIDGGLDPKVQGSAMQNAIASGKYNAIVLQPIDSTSLAVQVRAAASAGISVIALDYTYGPVDKQGELAQTMPQVKSTIGLGRTQVNDTFVKNIVGSCTAKVGAGKPCKVGLQAGHRGNAFSAVTSSTLKDALGKISYIRAGYLPDGELTSAGGYKSMTTYLQNNRDVDVTWAESDLQAIGITQAIRQAGLKPGKDVYINGYSGTKEAVANIRAGAWFSSVPVYPSEGAKAVRDAVALALGKTVAATTNEYSLPGAIANLTAATLKAHPDFESTWSATNG